MDKKLHGAGGPLGEDIRRLGREELIALALEVCEAAADCGESFHGNIHPGNITRDAEGRFELGPRADHAPGEWSTDELEYMAPELFWNGTADASADVYSIGLLLYAGVSGGLLPFFKKAPENMTNELRAMALRRRMNGDEIHIPAAAGERLGPVMEKCLRFEASERYKDTKELAEALRPCVGEGDAKAMEMFGKPERELSEVERTMAGILAHLEPEEEEEPEPAREPETPKEPEPEPEPPKAEPKRPKVELPPVKPVEPPKPTGPRPEYKVDRDFEERAIREKEARPKRNAKPVIIVLCLCVVIVIAALAVKFFLPGEDGEVTASPTPPAQTEQSGVVETAEPTPSPTPTPTPTPSPTPTPEPTYEIFVSDCTWEEAAALCEEKGGHLVVISDLSELSKVASLADEAGAQFVWIGLHRVDGELVWVTGEDIDYFIWGPGEPSVRDTDGTAEDYGLLWKTSHSGWIYNDSRNDPVSAYPGIYSGKIAYVCEYPPES